MPNPPAAAVPQGYYFTFLRPGGMAHIRSRGGDLRTWCGVMKLIELPIDRPARVCRRCAARLARDGEGNDG